MQASGAEEQGFQLPQLILDGFQRGRHRAGLGLPRRQGSQGISGDGRHRRDGAELELPFADFAIGVNIEP